jgi:hypothetical protein
MTMIHIMTTMTSDDIVASDNTAAFILFRCSAYTFGISLYSKEHISAISLHVRE